MFHSNSLGKALVVNLILHQINKFIEKGVHIAISLVWKDNAMVGILSSSNKGMTTLSVTVNGYVILNNDSIKDRGQRKQEGATRTGETNLCRTSIRQIPVTTKEDFYPSPQIIGRDFKNLTNYVEEGSSSSIGQS
jgi:hypothetical protein